MSIVFITVACVLLVAVVLRWMLKGPTHSRIRITINGERTIAVSGGDTLFNTLAREGIALPSTCGGKGSCALCRCRVLKGGGPIAERELPYFTRAEVAQKWRLACQVKVLNDLAIELPAGLSNAAPIHVPQR